MKYTLSFTFEDNLIAVDKNQALMKFVGRHLWMKDYFDELFIWKQIEEAGNGLDKQNSGGDSEHKSREGEGKRKA